MAVQNVFQVIKHSRLLLVAFIAYLFCILWRPIVALLLRVQHGKKARIMEGFDSSQVQAMCLGSSRHANHTNCVWILEGQSLKIEDLLEKFRCILKDENIFWKLKMRNRVFLGYWVWIPTEDFDLSHHIRFSELCKYKNRRHLARLVTELHGQEPCFSPVVSPWLVQVFFSADGTETALQVHADHSIMDAFGHFSLIGPALANDFKPQVLPKLPKEPFFKSELKAILKNFQHGILEAARHADKRCSSNNPIKAFMQQYETAIPIGLWSERIPLQRIKGIAKKWNTKFTTVLLACLSAAIDNLMEKHHKTSSRHDQFANGKLVVSCITTYSNWHQKSTKRLGNAYGGIIHDFPSRFFPGGFDSPAADLTLPERLEFFESSSYGEAARRAGAEFVWSTTSLVMKVASLRIAQQLASRLGCFSEKPAPFTVTLTNAVTYVGETDICGNLVKDIMAFMPMVAVAKGPGCVLTTYNGNAILGISGDSCIFPSQDSIAEFLHDFEHALYWLECKD